ncbi:hypothetical protein LXL04_013125 [Taraxacum kok-saghyz]
MEIVKDGDVYGQVVVTKQLTKENLTLVEEISSDNTSNMCQMLETAKLVLGIARSLNGAPSRSPLWSAHEEQTHRSLGNPRTTGVKPGCIASSWDRTPDLPKEANVDTHLIWKVMCIKALIVSESGYLRKLQGFVNNIASTVTIFSHHLSPPLLPSASTTTTTICVVTTTGGFASQTQQRRGLVKGYRHFTVYTSLSMAQLNVQLS